MEKLCIDVRGFSEEKKKRVQDAFFKLGIKWSGGCVYKWLDADDYGNVYWDGNAVDELMWGWGPGDMTEQQREHAITYPELMRKAGMDESDPDAAHAEKSNIKVILEKMDESKRIYQKMLDESAQIMKDFESPKLETPKLEYTRDIQDVIESYLHLLDLVDDEKAREVIFTQLADLTDLQFKQLGGGV